MPISLELTQLSVALFFQLQFSEKMIGIFKNALIYGYLGPFFSISFSRIVRSLENQLELNILFFKWDFSTRFPTTVSHTILSKKWSGKCKRMSKDQQHCLECLPAVLNVRISFPLIWVLLESRWVWRPLKFSSSSVCKLTHFKQLGSFYRKKRSSCRSKFYSPIFVLRFINRVFFSN